MVLGDVPPSEKLKIGRKRYEEDCMRIESNNALLSDGFKWAVQKAKTFVVSYTENGDINKGEGNKWYGPDGVVIDAPNADWASRKNTALLFGRDIMTERHIISGILSTNQQALRYLV